MGLDIVRVKLTKPLKYISYQDDVVLMINPVSLQEASRVKSLVGSEELLDDYVLLLESIDAEAGRFLEMTVNGVRKLYEMYADVFKPGDSIPLIMFTSNIVLEKNFRYLISSIIETLALQQRLNEELAVGYTKLLMSMQLAYTMSMIQNVAYEIAKDTKVLDPNKINDLIKPKSYDVVLMDVDYAGDMKLVVPVEYRDYIGNIILYTITKGVTSRVDDKLANQLKNYNYMQLNTLLLLGFKELVRDYARRVCNLSSKSRVEECVRKAYDSLMLQLVAQIDDLRDRFVAEIVRHIIKSGSKDVM